MVDLELYSWIARGTQRTAVIMSLTQPMTATQAYKKAKEKNVKITLNSTCSVLRAFVKVGLASCINTEKKTGRIFELTRLGAEIQAALMKI